jgi:hypothetical protein
MRLQYCFFAKNAWKISSHWQQAMMKTHVERQYCINKDSLKIILDAFNKS